MPIKGFFPTGYHLLPAPYVQAALMLPRLQLHGLINFMIDTGADNTTLSLIDVERINIGYRRLRRASLVGVEGIAGEQSFYQEAAMIMFREEDATTYLFPVNVHIPKKGKSRAIEQQRRLPSVLGRDILNYCNFTVNYQQGTVELIPPEGAKLPVPTRRLL